MDFDQEIINDFLEEYEDAQIEIEKIIAKLDQSLDEEVLKSLFRIVHTIKGNFCMLQLNPLSETIHTLEDLLSQIRDKEREFIPGLSLLISVTLEQCKQITKQIFIGKNKTDAIENLTQAYKDLCVSSVKGFKQSLLSTLIFIDEMGEYGHDYSSKALIDFLHQAEQQTETNSITPISSETNSPKKAKADEELDFFYQLITQVESYFPFWKGRSDKIYNLVSQMNEAYGYPVDPKQLQVAVYLHDIGMSFIPPQRIYIGKDLIEKDRKVMQSHCDLSYQWLKLIPGWDEAAVMISQHHERFDGKGYPLGLSQTDICNGAKLLAIGDAFASITGQEKKGTQKKPIMFAIAEINQGSGLQFDPDWVQVFNQVIRNLK